MSLSIQLGSILLLVAFLVAVGLLHQWAWNEWREPQDVFVTSSTSDISSLAERMGLEAAREKVPFDILTPEYLPDGFYPARYGEVLVIHYRADGEQVRAVMTIYQGSVTAREKWQLNPFALPEIRVLQKTSAEDEMTVESSQQPPVTVWGYPAEIVLPDPTVDHSTLSLTTLRWIETERRVEISVSSPIPYGETLQVVRSLK